MIEKTIEVVSDEFRTDFVEGAEFGEYAMPDDVVLVTEIGLAHVTAGFSEAESYYADGTDCPLGSFERENDSAEAWTQALKDLKPLRARGASWHWEEIEEYSSAATCLGDLLCTVPIRICGDGVELGAISDIQIMFLEAFFVGEAVGIEVPRFEDVKSIWRAGGFVMGMEGCVSDVWPNGRFVVYWPYPLEKIVRTPS